MSARDAFESSSVQKGIGISVLLVDFHELAVEDFHCRLKMLSESKLITRLDSTPLMGAPWMLETFRHRLVFVRLRERHMCGTGGETMNDFLAQLAASPDVAVIPIVSRRGLLDHFRRHLSQVSPMYLGTSFLQADLLHILGAYAFTKPSRRKLSRMPVPGELDLAQREGRSLPVGASHITW